MMKELKFLVILLLFMSALALYVFLTPKSVKMVDAIRQRVTSKSSALSEEGYKTKVKEIFSNYEKLAADNNFTVDKLAGLKNQMLGLKLDSQTRADFQKLHIGIIQALDKMENYLKDNKKQDKDDSEQIISQLKTDYSWLSDQRGNTPR